MFVFCLLIFDCFSFFFFCSLDLHCLLLLVHLLFGFLDLLLLCLCCVICFFAFVFFGCVCLFICFFFVLLCLFVLFACWICFFGGFLLFHLLFVVFRICFVAIAFCSCFFLFGKTIRDSLSGFLNLSSYTITLDREFGVKFLAQLWPPDRKQPLAPRLVGEQGPSLSSANDE